MNLKRPTYWIFSILIWLASVGLIYLGLIIFAFAPMLGPRGNIDFIDLSAQQKRSARIQTALTYAVGVIPLTAAYFAFTRRKQFLNRVLKHSKTTNSLSPHA